MGNDKMEDSDMVVLLIISFFVITIFIAICVMAHQTTHRLNDIKDMQQAYYEHQLDAKWNGDSFVQETKCHECSDSCVNIYDNKLYK